MLESERRLIPAVRAAANFEGVAKLAKGSGLGTLSLDERNGELYKLVADLGRSHLSRRLIEPLRLFLKDLLSAAPNATHRKEVRPVQFRVSLADGENGLGVVDARVVPA